MRIEEELEARNALDIARAAEWAEPPEEDEGEGE